MHAGLNPLLRALDAAPAPVDFFLRDDDAGWDDAALFALLDCTGRAGVPIDLAVIPQSCSPALAAALALRAQSGGAPIGMHQHGFAHTNHETTERKCEFGPSRDTEAQRRDLLEGQQRLRDLFGAQLDPFFTPPWNRCSAATPTLLAGLGFDALSRSRGAPAQQALPELPVDVDWCKHRRLAQAQRGDGCESIAAELSQRVCAGGPVGLMLHHAAMDTDDLALLAQLFAATHHHPHARWQPMRRLLADRPSGHAT